MLAKSQHECLPCVQACGEPFPYCSWWQANYLISIILMKASHVVRVYPHAVMLYDAACAGWKGGFAAFAALQDDRQQQQASNQSRLAASIAGQATFVPETLHQLHMLWCRITSTGLLTQHPNNAACPHSHCHRNECCYESCHDAAHVIILL